MKKSSRRPAPKKLRAIQTSRHLGVVPHRHTGHLTHRRTTAYPTLVMIMLCVGVFLASWTRWVTADSFVYPGPVTNTYTVHASVPGPPPTVAAVIDTPDPGSTFTELPITIAGSCPLDTYVNVYRNGAYSGTALCQPDGRFSLQSALFASNNQLEARVFSLTDVPGPLSTPVAVTYTPPTPPSDGSSHGTSGGGAATSGGTSSSASPLEPLIFKTAFSYEGHYAGDPTTWQFDLEGGTEPYAISVDWGDGQHDLISRPRPGVFSLQHTYKKAGAYRGSYVIKLSASDSEGQKTFLQLLTIVNDPPASGGATTKKPTGFSPTTPDYLRTITRYIWPGYGIVLLMLVSFWLGERREFHLLKPHSRKAGRRHA